MHQGHRSLAKAASDLAGTPVAYELSVANVDKPPLEESEVRRRVAQFGGEGSIILTHVPVFYEKADLLPGCTFVIGVDTAVRLFDPRYYDDSMSRMLLALQRLEMHDCRFLVAGRIDDGVFRTLSDVVVPWGFEHMFTPIPESAFRSDISSTELRQARGVASA